MSIREAIQAAYRNGPEHRPDLQVGADETEALAQEVMREEGIASPNFVRIQNTLREIRFTDAQVRLSFFQRLFALRQENGSNRERILKRSEIKVEEIAGRGFGWDLIHLEEDFRERGQYLPLYFRGMQVDRSAYTWVTSPTLGRMFRSMITALARRSPQGAAMSMLPAIVLSGGTMVFERDTRTDAILSRSMRARGIQPESTGNFPYEHIQFIAGILQYITESSFFYRLTPSGLVYSDPLLDSACRAVTSCNSAEMLSSSFFSWEDFSEVIEQRVSYDEVRSQQPVTLVSQLAELQAQGPVSFSNPHDNRWYVVRRALIQEVLSRATEGSLPSAWTALSQVRFATPEDRRRFFTFVTQILHPLLRASFRRQARNASEELRRHVQGFVMNGQVQGVSQFRNSEFARIMTNLMPRGLPFTLGEDGVQVYFPSNVNHFPVGADLEGPYFSYHELMQIVQDVQRENNPQS